MEWKYHETFKDYSFTPDIDAYFKRIEYDGPRETNLDVLRNIQLKHNCSIPFENFDIHFGKITDINPRQIEDKFLNHGRGGYCFEQNNYLFYVLRELGFQLKPVLARVRWGVPEGVHVGLLHLVLIVYLDGVKYLVDGCFGTSATVVPLQIEYEGHQKSPIDTRRIVKKSDDIYLHQAQKYGCDDEWIDIYTFKEVEATPYDCEVGNFFTSLSPESIFVKGIIVTKILKVGEDEYQKSGGDLNILYTDKVESVKRDIFLRYVLFDTEFTTRFMDGSSIKKTLESTEELQRILAEKILITFLPRSSGGVSKSVGSTDLQPPIVISDTGALKVLDPHESGGSVAVGSEPPEAVAAKLEPIFRKLAVNAGL